LHIPKHLLLLLTINEVKQYVSMIKHSLNQKAIKIVNVCKQFDIFL